MFLSDDAIRAVKGQQYTALTPYEKLGDRRQFGWAKSENWRIAKEMSLEELEQTDFGQFIQRLCES